MQRELNFVPKILLCGDEAEFLSRVGQRPFKIVGRMQISGEGFNFESDGKILLDGKLQHFNELLKMIRKNPVDYFVTTTLRGFYIFYDLMKSIGIQLPKVVTIEQFKSFPLGFFYSFEAELPLLTHLKELSMKTLLDVDAYFAKGQLFSKMDNDLTEIDCISQERMLPIKENIYRRVYKNFTEVGFRRYDAVLIVERPPIDFMSMFNLVEKFSDRVITFARTGSELEKYILTNRNNFSAGSGLRTETGTWFFLTRHKPQENFCIYVVTHKPTPHDGKLLEGYKIIHAGRALNPDLGYLGDNTGDNISDLNLFLNETTALYWMWKNTNHTTIGLAHYRRFFTESDNETFAYEKILTKDAALKILEDYDIIATFYKENKHTFEAIKTECGIALAEYGELITKKYLLQTHPDYLDVVDYELNSPASYKSTMFVTRRDIFEAYCKWLFSFIIDATREVLRTVPLQNLPWTPRRLMSFLAERMFSVWLFKNRLRIKELKHMFIEGI